MEKKEFPNWVKIVVVIIIIVVCFFSIRNQKSTADKLKERGRYAIGKTEGWSHNHRSSDFAVDFSYSVDKVVYKNFVLIPSITGIQTKGGKYIVIFDPKNPKESKILFDLKVAYTTLLNYPDTGWKKIPDFVVFSKDTGHLR